MEREILWLPETDSTNEYVKRRVADPEGPDVVATNRQTAGKGTHGRRFFSEGGLYFSFVRKDLPDAVVPYVTRMAAVATQRALAHDFGANTRIKWVNDLCVGKKKVCGILCERTADGAVVVGIGLNLTEPAGGYPEEIRGIAASIFRRPLSRDEQESLIAAVLRYFDATCREGRLWEVHADYDAYLYGKRRRAIVQTDAGSYEGILLGVNADGYLLIEGEQGVRAFFSGTLRFLPE